jgi:hypothetical protein
MLASIAMERSTKHGMAKHAPVGHYDPENFKYTKRVDSIFAKEMFFTVRNKDPLWNALEACLKPRGQLLFTDYVLEHAESRTDGLRSWFAHEPVEPLPLTVDQYCAAFQQRNLDIRITEDITDQYRSLILTAIQSLHDHLSCHSMDNGTRLAVIEEVELWARRVAALQDGLKVFRILALKPNDA